LGVRSPAHEAKLKSATEQTVVADSR